MISEIREAPATPPTPSPTSCPLTSSVFAAYPIWIDRNRIRACRWFETATDVMPHACCNVRSYSLCCMRANWLIREYGAHKRVSWGDLQHWSRHGLRTLSCQPTFNNERRECLWTRNAQFHSEHQLQKSATLPHMYVCMFTFTGTQNLQLSSVCPLWRFLSRKLVIICR